MKKKIKIIATTLALIGAMFSLSGAAAYATTNIDDYSPDPSGFTIPGTNDGSGNCRSFLGMTSWDCGLPSTDPWAENNIKTSIITIILNITSDLTIIASYLVLAFIIYGGYRYLFSGGDAARLAAGKRILIHAVIGLAIVLASNIIFNAIRFGVMNGSEQGEKLVGGVKVAIGTSDPVKIFGSSLGWAIGVAGVAALAVIVYGGILMVTANGNAAKVQRAKDAILYAGIGLLVVALAEALTSFITTRIVESKKYGEQQSYLNAPIVRVISLEEINHEETM